MFSGYTALITKKKSMLLYLLSALLFVQLLIIISQIRLLREIKKRDKSGELAMSTLSQWIVTNDKSVMQNLGHVNEVMHSLYIRTRMIDLALRSKTNGEKHSNGHEFHDLEAVLGKENWPNGLITESTHKDAIEKIRSEDIHYYYTSLIEQLQHLNKQIGGGAVRGESHIGTGNIGAGRNENANPVNGWYNRVNKVV